jgi:DNA-binding MarR family transcriptional regulator/GNAT superfamily N-acetyltransferase
MQNGDLSQKAAAIRRFNRFYTRQIGLLQEGLLDSPHSLTEGRIIYELAHRQQTTASVLAADLGLDPGYLSRILAGFQKRGLISRRASTADGRQKVLSLTPRGEEEYATLNSRSQVEIERMLGNLSMEQQDSLVGSMGAIENILGTAQNRTVACILRPPQPGDMGWVISRHGVLYAREYGWDASFEALVAEIVSRFMKLYEPKIERCWIAEIDGENVGSVFLVKENETTARLRLLLVEPKARGLGVGTRLVQECVRFARQAGYRTMTLWTNDVLAAAREIYQKAGFRLVHEEMHYSFGQDLVGQTWELEL